jgi:hypothetical protein
LAANQPFPIPTILIDFSCLAVYYAPPSHKGWQEAFLVEFLELNPV